MGNDPVVFSVNKGHRNIEICVPAHGVEDLQDVQGNRHIFIAKSNQCQEKTTNEGFTFVRAMSGDQESTKDRCNDKKYRERAVGSWNGHLCVEHGYKCV